MGTLVLVFCLWLTFNIPPLISGRSLNDEHKRELVSMNPGFISIDCGAPVDNPDESNIYYQTDREFESNSKGPPPLQLCDWVIPYVERKEIENIVDPRLQRYSINSAWRAIEVAMACLPSLAVQRPDISYVYDELKECLKMEMDSEKPLVMKGNQTWSSGLVHTTPLDYPKTKRHHTCYLLVLRLVQD